MARKADPNSTRQQAFKYLDKIKSKGMKREKVIAALKEKFSIGDAYAATLYAAHRTIAKEKGAMIKVYSIRDMKDGKPVDPYLRVEHVFKASKNAALSPEEAMDKYIRELNHKKEVVESMLESKE